MYPSGIMLDFKDQVFHLTLKVSWVFVFHWGASSAQHTLSWIYLCL